MMIMRKAKKEKTDGSVSTFLGPDVTIQGAIEFKSVIRLDGKIEGKIIGPDGTVIVGEKAVINAEIVVGVAIIMGEVNGEIKALKKIEIHPPGRVVGDIQAPIISIAAGGVLNGNCSMKTRPVASGKRPETSAAKKSAKGAANKESAGAA